MIERKGLTTKQQIDEMWDELNTRTSSKKIKKNSFKKTQSIIHSVLFIILVLFLIAILLNILSDKKSGKIPSVFGYHLFFVETSSMDPTLPVGTIIISKRPKKPTEIKNNTIVTFYNTEGEVITHRIINVITDENNNIIYQTKGDNPINTPDSELLTPERIIGVFIAKVPLT